MKYTSNVDTPCLNSEANDEEAMGNEPDTVLQPLSVAVINGVIEASDSIRDRWPETSGGHFMPGAIYFQLRFEYIGYFLHLVDCFAFRYRGDDSRTLLMERLAPAIMSDFVEYGITPTVDMSDESIAQHKMEMKDAIWELLNEAHYEYSAVNLNDAASERLALLQLLTERISRFTYFPTLIDLLQLIVQTVGLGAVNAQIGPQTMLAVNLLTR